MHTNGQGDAASGSSAPATLPFPFPSRATCDSEGTANDADGKKLVDPESHPNAIKMQENLPVGELGAALAEKANGKAVDG